MGTVERLAWQRSDPPNLDSVSRLLGAEGLEPIAWSNGPGDRYARHAHAYEKVLWCAAGSIRFRVGDPPDEVELTAGAGLVLRAGTPHSAVVGPAGCTCVEGHRPV